MLSKGYIINYKIPHKSTRQMTELRVSYSFWDEEGMKDGGKDRGITVELNIYTLTNSE